jgi:hypothetical protein
MGDAENAKDQATGAVPVLTTKPKQKNHVKLSIKF